MEIYEGGISEFNSNSYINEDFKNSTGLGENITNFTSLPSFQKVINLLRETVDDREIIGCGIFTNNGQVLYSSAIIIIDKN